MATIDTRMNYARRWEIWDEFGNIAAIIAKAFLSGKIWVAISHTPSPEENIRETPRTPAILIFNESPVV